MRDVLSPTPPPPPRHDRLALFCAARVLACRAGETEDAVTDAFRDCCERFVRLDDLDNRAAAQAIAQDRVDVLID